MAPEAEHGRPGLRRPPRFRRVAQWLTVFLLSVAGVATSWNGYQAARWGNVQAERYWRASMLRLESTRAQNTAEQFIEIDVAVFIAWVGAYLQGDTRLTQFYEERFRDEFNPAFRAWLAQDPLDNHDAAPTPFHLPEYRLAKAQEALDFSERAELAFQEGEEANHRSDEYVMSAVVLATVLFFAGISKIFKVHAMQYVLLGLAAALFAVCAWDIATLPKLF
jgi:hypothetical protein